MTTQLRIAIVLPPREKFSPDSAGALALCSYETAQTSSFNRSITVYGPDAETPFSGINFHPIDASVRWYQSQTKLYLKQLSSLFKENPPDIIEIHNRTKYLEPLRRACRTAKIILAVHNDPATMDGLGTATERRHTFSLCDRVIACSQFVATQLSHGLDQDNRDKISVIYPSVTIPKKQRTKEKEILFVGRLTEEKGVRELVEACQMVLPKHPSWRLRVVGSVAHGDSRSSGYAKDILKRIRSLGAQAIHEPYVPHETVLEYFAQAEICVVPSIWLEPFGRVAAEAAANRCAVISSGLGGLKEIIDDHSGVILNDITPTDIAHALISLIGNNTLRKELQQAAYRKAENFTLAQSVAAMDTLRKEILET